MILAMVITPGPGGADDTAEARSAHAEVNTLRDEVRVSFLFKAKYQFIQ